MGGNAKHSRVVDSAAAPWLPQVITALESGAWSSYLTGATSGSERRNQRLTALCVAADTEYEAAYRNAEAAISSAVMPTSQLPRLLARLQAGAAAVGRNQAAADVLPAALLEDVVLARLGGKCLACWPDGWVELARGVQMLRYHEGVLRWLVDVFALSQVACFTEVVWFDRNRWEGEQLQRMKYVRYRDRQTQKVAEVMVGEAGSAEVRQMRRTLKQLPVLENAIAAISLAQGKLAALRRALGLRYRDWQREVAAELAGSGG